MIIIELLAKISSDLLQIQPSVIYQFDSMLRTHMKHNIIRSTEIVEQLCMLLQRLCTSAPFALKVKKTKLRDHLGHLNMDLKKFDQEIEWQEVDKNDDAQALPMGERTKTFVMMNIRSILKNIENSCSNP